MKTTNFGEQWSAMEKMFLPNTEMAAKFREAISAAFVENVHRFWENQEKVLDSMQAVADGWFERRRVGTHKAREAAEEMCQFESFEDLGRIHRDWASEAFERIMPDGRSCQQPVLAMMGVFGSFPLAASRGEKPAEPARSGAKISAASNAA